MARIAVAATAPFGADVLERLAAHHEISALLTRPDAPRGRGRRLAPPPAKVVAEQHGIPVLQPERPTEEDLGAATVIVCAYGLLIPDQLLGAYSFLNVHPSLLPRWRGAAPVERAILAGDAQTGVTIHETVTELDAGPIAAQSSFAIGGEDDAGAVFARAAAVAVELLDAVLAKEAPAFVSQGTEGVTYAEKITAADRRLDLDLPAVELVRRVRALSPHIGARAELHGKPLTIWTARVDECGAFEPVEVQPDGASAWTRRPGCAASDEVGRDLAGAVGGLRRHPSRLRARGVRRSCPTGRRRRSRCPGSRARAPARVRNRAADAHARSCDRAVWAPPREQARRAGARGSAPRRVPAGLPGRSPAVRRHESVELVRRARLERAVPFTNAVPRRLADDGRASIENLPETTAAEAALRHSYPDWIAETWWRDLGRDGALALMQAGNEAPPTVVRLVRGEIDGRPDPDVPGAWHVDQMDEGLFEDGRIWPQSVGSQLAGLSVASSDADRVLDLCAAPGGKATMLRGDVVAVEVNPFASP